MGRRPSNLPAFAGRALVLVAGAAIALGCVARAQGFEAWNGSFRADVSDRTGTVASITVLERPGPGSELAGGAIRLRNVDRQTVELAWLGGACATNARFSLAPEPNDAIGLRYEVGGACDAAVAAGYALEIRFVRPVDAATIDAVPDWGP